MSGHLTKALLDLSEVSLALDTYDDIFSDFDPRPYNHRAISEDLLKAADRACRDKPFGEVEIRFMVPKKIRDKKKEEVIKKRLIEHFKRHHMLTHKDKNKVIKIGLSFIFVSIFVMYFAAFFFFEKMNTDLLSRFLFVLLEPAGWFLFWEGLDLLIFEAKKKNPEVIFYDKMSKADIEFIEY